MPSGIYQRVGFIPWNRGLTKETDKRIKEYAEKKRGKRHNLSKNERMRRAERKKNAMETNGGPTGFEG